MSLTSLETTTRGTDICNIVVKELDERKVDLSKTASVATDGVCSMMRMALSIYLLSRLGI